MSTKLQKQYVEARETEGLTVAEFEKSLGLPRWSVYPELKDQTDPNAVGTFMYDLPANHKMRINNSHSVFRDSDGITGTVPNQFKGLGGCHKVGGEQAKRNLHWKNRRWGGGKFGTPKIGTSWDGNKE